MVSRQRALRHAAADPVVSMLMDGFRAEGIATARPWRVAATVRHSLHNAIEKDLVRLPVPPLLLGGSLDPIAPPRWRTEAARLRGAGSRPSRGPRTTC